MQPTDDERRKHARDVAEEMENILELTEKNEKDTIALMERLTKQATALRAHAERWERINPDRAAKVRQDEQEVLALHARLARLANLEADEVASIMAEVDKKLDEAEEPGA
jgi:hypothetical protein